MWAPHPSIPSAAMRRALIAALAALPLLTAGPAAAEITASQLTAPADGQQVTSVDATTQLPVAGTTTGGTLNEGLTLMCFRRSGVADVVGSVLLDGGGAFSGSASVSGVRGPCTLRAVPASFDTAGSDPAPFGGRLITVEAQRTTALSSGPNTGQVTSLDDWLQQSAAGVGICSLGSTGLCGSRLFDGALRSSSEPVFNAGGWIGSTTGTRSYLQVDGANAYPPFRAAQVAFEAPGIIGLTRTTVRSPASEVESDGIVRCNTTAFPPGAACTAFQDTGVRYERTTLVSADGTTVEQRDALVSVDGRAHTVSAYLGENFLIGPEISPALRFGWLPGDTAAVRAGGSEYGGPTKGPATIYVGVNAAAPDGDPVYPQGAITFDRPPASVRVTAPTDLLVRFPDLSVPAGGRAELVRTTYVTTRTAADAAARARALEDRLVGPAVTISSPKAGARVLTPTVTVTGTATDNDGLASLTVGGRPVTPGPTGRFSVSVPMVKGANTVTAVAVDHAGNQAQATLKLTYQDRLPPLVGPLYLKPAVWRVGRPTTVRFSLGEAGTMRLTASRVTGGRSRRGTCVASTPALRRARAKVCVRHVQLAAVVEPKRAGGVAATIGPKTGGRLLKPGRVQLRVTVTDYARNVSKARTLDTTLRPPLKRRSSR
jgi:hypothetical protein